MTQDKANALHYSAEEGKTFVQKETGLRYGGEIYLAETDSIDNYQEEDMTAEEIQAKADAENKQEEQKESVKSKSK